MKVIDNIDALLTEIRRIKVQYVPEGIQNTIIKDLEIEGRLLSSLFSNSAFFNNVIFSNCNFSDVHARGAVDRVKVSIDNSVKFINCVFNYIPIEIHPYGSIYSDYSLVFKGVQASYGNISVQGVLKNLTIIDSSFLDSIITIKGANSNYSLLNIIGSTISSLQFGVSSFYNTDMANISDNVLSVKSSDIKCLRQSESNSRIYYLTKSGTTLKSLFGGSVKKLELNVEMTRCDFSGVDFSNTEFQGDEFTISNCNVTGADFTNIKYTSGPGFALAFKGCSGVDEALFPKDAEIIYISDYGPTISVIFK